MGATETSDVGPGKQMLIDCSLLQLPLTAPLPAWVRWARFLFVSSWPIWPIWQGIARKRVIWRHSNRVRTFRWITATSSFPSGTTMGRLKGTGNPFLHRGGEIDRSYEPDFLPVCRAQDYFRRNFYAMFVGKLCGLLAIITVPSILRVLVHTNQSSEPRTAYRRYVATIMHTLEWYFEDFVPTSR